MYPEANLKDPWHPYFFTSQKKLLMGLLIVKKCDSRAIALNKTYFLLLSMSVFLAF